MNKKNDTSNIVAQNRKASFNYFFEEQLEAGIELSGSEVKSLREGKGSIADSYALDQEGELYLHNSYIPEYRQSSYNNHEPRRLRKLLLKKKEINKLVGKINRDGFTIVPTRIYFNKKGIAKVSIGLSKGRKLQDKREYKKKMDWKKQQERLVKK